ncbi:hypothetical protein AVV23_gp72 [Paenibacillus phage Sitara]|uniref:Uncharacterized protein n=1 Tax=Paenibacillus phage Sitara TaxID=1589755 RepID=A0A0C5AN71_9CAUD|nr:hypothetical protein AVV23_gp72 [Paenibacillus phage Sitara]AJK28060.1 hypothetical protein SITARA_72 [Paenibacillus phage Sitara]
MKRDLERHLFVKSKYRMRVLYLSLLNLNRDTEMDREIESENNQLRINSKGVE